MPPVAFSHVDFDPAALVEAKGHGSDRQTVSVCLPARNEAATVGIIVDRIRRDLIDDVPLVDELMVIDDHSTDDTAMVAAEAGATVIAAATIAPEVAGPGKGQALWKSLHASKGDVILWCDADLDRFEAHFVSGLLGPLLTRPDIGFVKASYRRPLVDDEGGGRVTELVARPVLSNLLPHLSGFAQPLSGEYGGRRSVLEAVPFVDGYGVDIALLADIAARIGTEAMAEVDLGERHHRNRSLEELGPQAVEVLRAALSRCRATVNGRTVAVTDPVTLVRPGRDDLTIMQRELPAIAGG